MNSFYLVALVCLVVPLVYCNIIVDDFQDAQTIANIFDGSERLQVETATTNSDLYYARRISTRKNPGPRLDVTVGGGVLTNDAVAYSLGDRIQLEYWYGTNAINYPLPAGVTRADNPFPNNYIDWSSVVNLVADFTWYGDFQLGEADFQILVEDADGNVYAPPFGGYYELMTPGSFHYEWPVENRIVPPVSGNIDRSRIVYFSFTIIQVKYDMSSFYFSEAVSCTASSNVNSAAAVPIPYNVAAPASFSVETCGACNAADFTGFSASVQRDNVFWFSVAQQNVAYSVTFSSQSFAGYNDAYLWVFDAQGNLLASIDNLSADLFEATVEVDEVPIFVAVGAECSIVSFTLDVSFSAEIVDISLQLEEVSESLTALINTGFDGVGNQLGDLSTQLYTAQTNILGAIDQSTTTVTGLITSETNEIDGEIADLETDLANVNTNINTHLDGKFTDLTTSLGSSFGGVNQELQNIADQISDQCGSSSDGVASLSTYLNAQWTNWRNQQIIDKLVTGALVPAHYQTPVSQGGILEDIYTFVANTFITKKNLADSQKTTPTSSTCKTGVDGAYCAFFYRFPSGSGSAQSAYQTAISSYNSWVGQARYAKAFQSLATAYNALFMGQA